MKGNSLIFAAKRKPYGNTHPHQQQIPQPGIAPQAPSYRTKFG
jgi:hypothetical protein